MPASATFQRSFTDAPSGSVSGSQPKTGGHLGRPEGEGLLAGETGGQHGPAVEPAPQLAQGVQQVLGQGLRAVGARVPRRRRQPEKMAAPDGDAASTTFAG